MQKLGLNSEEFEKAMSMLAMISFGELWDVGDGFKMLAADFFYIENERNERSNLTLVTLTLTNIYQLPDFRKHILFNI